MASTHNQIDARSAIGRARSALPVSLAAAFDRICLHDDDAGTVGTDKGKAGVMAVRFASEWVRICADELAAYYQF